MHDDAVRPAAEEGPQHADEGRRLPQGHVPLTSGVADIEVEDAIRLRQIHAQAGGDGDAGPNVAGLEVEDGELGPPQGRPKIAQVGFDQVRECSRHHNANPPPSHLGTAPAKSPISPTLGRVPAFVLPGCPDQDGYEGLPRRLGLAVDRPLQLLGILIRSGLRSRPRTSSSSSSSTIPTSSRRAACRSSTPGLTRPRSWSSCRSRSCSRKVR